MWSPRHTVVSVFLGILAATWLFGCRAFDPEAVIVNKPPETYIIGSPAETTGAYFHYHVYWYGTDDDGEVDRFVWALTDTSIQDPAVVGDEEDENFNPATNISTLSRGHWTARTDSVFDFRINQGSVLSTDMTLAYGGCGRPWRFRPHAGPAAFLQQRARPPRGSRSTATSSRRRRSSRATTPSPSANPSCCNGTAPRSTRRLTNLTCSR